MPLIENTLTILLLWAVLGYLIGSVPFGVVVARVMGLGNLRDIGSGNIGATNVLRTGSKPAAAATLILDAAKGAVALLLARSISGEDAAQVAALAAMIGHCFPVWLRFRGGKGVATFLGILLALAWPAGIAACVAWLIGAAITRISSMGGLFSAAVSSLLVTVLGYGEGFLLCLALTAIIFWRHRANIARIRAGTEPKIGQKT
ncbi:glycerol-3-phosphate 1-O-acyltransferase PlsY [Sulfitobacter sp. F26169L]|uniref:glycerol-3-phosphate 1-O-acyltransferase PlsY n=1 Tax=Sulfitobacter sp. F26169L TaxID=2996015 RepID=UPI0022609396|nr:glycerol-3-phosphate 1-O-acyltransferase PlsY [Sulfitobacter sp. F26169L]MCX7566905.1 glycerol-3-phosphate 1-O-acyltransferase PlsY [Sulfitobacter sp. F26169L]